MTRDFLGVWIPKEIYLHKGLTPTEKLLLAEITSFSKNGVCFASNEHFAEFLGISKKHVSKLVSKLAQMGLISVELIYKEDSKEVDRRNIRPIHFVIGTDEKQAQDPMDIKADTPTPKNGYPLLIEEDTPTPENGYPLLVDAYYKEQVKIQSKEQVKDKEQKTKQKSLSSSELEREFEQLWQIYPRKIGRKKAFESFVKARKVKKVTYEIIQNGLYRYITYIEQNETDEQFIQHASTWFNQEKWLDDYVSIQAIKKPKNALEYYRMKQEEAKHEPSRDGKVIDMHTASLSQFFQGL